MDTSSLAAAMTVHEQPIMSRVRSCRARISINFDCCYQSVGVTSNDPLTPNNSTSHTESGSASNSRTHTNIMAKQKVCLAYSGGLDTSCILRYLLVSRTDLSAIATSNVSLAIFAQLQV